MNKNPGVSLNIDEEMIQPIIEKQIQTAVIREVEKMPELLPKMIDLVLHKKVDSSGKKSNYSRDNKYDWIDITFQNAIRDAVKEAIKNYISENMGEVRDAFEDHIQESKSELAQAFVTGATKALEKSWKFSVDVILPEKEY